MMFYLPCFVRLFGLIPILVAATVTEPIDMAVATQLKRWIPVSTGNQNDVHFVGYMFDGRTWQAFNCNPGMSFTVIGDAAGCVSETWSVVAIASTCIDNSIILGPPGYATGGSWTCTGDGTTQACRVALIYPNLDDLASPKTIISCDASGGTFSVFRATTYATGVASVTASTTSIQSQKSQSSSFQSSTSLITSSASSTISNANPSPGAPTSGSDNIQSNKIALGVGVGIGIPALVITFCAWWFPRHGSRQRESKQAAGEVRAYNGESPPLRTASKKVQGELAK